jgi:hypothetical protein
MKYFDPANFPAKATRQVTIYGSVITLTGSSGTADITINGIKNGTILTYTNSLTTDAATWVTNNYVAYYKAGYSVVAAAGVITVTPAWGWDTVNRINATIANVTGNLNGTLAGVFEPDLAKAKTWQVKFGQSITVKRPKGMREGDRIRLEFLPSGAYTTTFPTDSTAYYFPGGTENVQTSTALDTVTGTCNIWMFPREDRITLTGTGGTANITAGGTTVNGVTDSAVGPLTKLVTWNGSGLSATADDFVTSWAAAYLAIGLVVTNSSGVLIFKASDTTSAKAKGAFFPQAKIANVTTNLSGTVATADAGRIIVDAASQNHIQ